MQLVYLDTGCSLKLCVRFYVFTFFENPQNVIFNVCFELLHTFSRTLTAVPHYQFADDFQFTVKLIVQLHCTNKKIRTSPKKTNGVQFLALILF